MSKSRGERGKTPAQLQPASVPISNDVVPGRFSESDWNHMLDEETEEDFVSDILQEVVTTALDQIYYKIIEQRIIPYTVNATKDVLLEVIEWQFLVRDPGETGVNEDQTWLEDEEPNPPITDSWAQGIVPVVINETFSPNEYTNEESQISEPEITAEEDQATSRVPQPSPDSSTNQTNTMESSQKKSDAFDDDSNNQTQSFQSPKPPQKLKQTNTGKSFKPYRGKVPSFRPITMTPITDDKSKLKQQHSINETAVGAISSNSNIQAYYGRSLGSKDTRQDQKGNTINMQKLNMDKLPSHRVKIKFAVVDPVEEEFKAKLANNKQRYNLHRNGGADNRTNAACVVIDSTSSKENELKLVSPLPPPLVDTINVAPGVVIKEKGVIKRGIRQPLNQFQSLEPLGNSFKSMDDEMQTDAISSFQQLNKNRPLPAIATRD